MPRQLAWTQDAWQDDLYWQTQDRKTLKRVNALIADVLRTPFEGIGKPEALRENLSGITTHYWLDVDARHRPFGVAEDPESFQGT
jgi:Txe/YoeB family toxin of toxin-antitoxin system